MLEVERPIRAVKRDDWRRFRLGTLDASTAVDRLAIRDVSRVASSCEAQTRTSEIRSSVMMLGPSELSGFIWPQPRRAARDRQPLQRWRVEERGQERRDRARPSARATRDVDLRGSGNSVDLTTTAYRRTSRRGVGTITRHRRFARLSDSRRVASCGVLRSRSRSRRSTTSAARSTIWSTIVIARLRGPASWIP